MSNPRDIKTYNAGGVIGQNCLVKAGANDGEVLQASAATDLIIGICITPGGVVQGDRVDIASAGFQEVLFGGVVARGQPVTSDANGKGVVAAPGAGVNNRYVGFAEVTTASGDIARVIVTPGYIQG